jgi:integrase
MLPGGEPIMSKRNLTDRLLKSLKAAKPRCRYEIMDSAVPGFGVRVTDKGGRTFVLVDRFPSGRHPTRRSLGDVDSMSLATARQKAQHWLKLIGEGKDPSAEQERDLRERQRQQANTFEAVADHYLHQVVIGRDPAKPKQRKGGEVERIIRKVLTPLWGRRPITDISRGDVLAVIEGIRDLGTAQMLVAHGIKVPAGNSKPAPDQARNVLGYLKTMFGWAIERGTYGLEASPCDHLRSARIVGEKVSRDRLLSDDEVLAFWRATGRTAYPYGPLYRLLLLKGLRLNEAADAAWTEFDPGRKLWTIPAERMKGRNGRVRAHVVPLTTEALAILESLPRFRNGDHLFSTSYGERPAWVSSKVKDRLDSRMLRTLRALARRRGDDPRKVVLAPWVNHDLRRTIRSGLSQLRVNSDVAEAILAHVKPGIRGVYDRFEFLAERRQALDLWAARVREIVNPPPANVVKLAARA